MYWDRFRCLEFFSGLGFSVGEFFETGKNKPALKQIHKFMGQANCQHSNWTYPAMLKWWRRRCNPDTLTSAEKWVFVQSWLVTVTFFSCWRWRWARSPALDWIAGWGRGQSSLVLSLERFPRFPSRRQRMGLRTIILIQEAMESLAINTIFFCFLFVKIHWFAFFELTRRPSRALDSPGALLLELQRYKDTVRSAALGAEVPGHRRQQQLTQTLIVRLLQTHFFTPYILDFETSTE